MDVEQLMSRDTIFLPLEVNDKADCIRKMASGLHKAGFVSSESQYVEAVMDREKTGSTGIGFGVAIPHGKSAGVAKPGLAFARLAQSIDWDSLDGSPVSMVFMIAVPEANVGNEHLQILIALSRKLVHEDFRQRLLSAQTTDEIVDILKTIG